MGDADTHKKQKIETKRQGDESLSTQAHPVTSHYQLSKPISVRTCTIKCPPIDSREWTSRFSLSFKIASYELRQRA